MANGAASAGAADRGLDPKIIDRISGLELVARTIVEGFLAAGIDRVYISARKINEIEETCAELGDKVIGIQGDLSTIEGIEALVEALQRCDAVSETVNN